MSVLLSDLVVYGSVNMTEADGATVGGAVDFTRRLSFVDVSPTGLMDVVSSSASDTATKIIYSGRDSTGVIQSETLTLNGTTKVAGTKTLERLLYGALSNASATGPLANPGGTTAVGDVALMSHTLVVAAHTAQAGSVNKTVSVPALMKLQAGDGAGVAVGQIIRTTGGTGPNQLRYIVAATGYGTDFVAINRDWTVLPDATTTYEVAQGFLFEISPNAVTSIIRIFSGTASDIVGGAQRVYYEKGFVVDNHLTLALTAASIAIQSETGALPGTAALDVALCKALNDTATAANRQTLPANGDASALTFTTGAPPQTQAVPTPGNLPSGAAPNAAGAQGVWLRLTLPAGTAAYKGSADLRTTGSSI